MDCLFDWPVWSGLVWSGPQPRLAPSRLSQCPTHAKLFPHPLPRLPSLCMPRPLFVRARLRQELQPLGAAQCAIGGADLAVVHRQRWLLIDAHAHDMPHSRQAERGRGERWGYWQSGLELLMLHIINLLCCCRCSKLPLAMSRLISLPPFPPLHSLSPPAPVYDAFMAALAISAKRVASSLVVSSVISFAFEIAQEIDWVGKVSPGIPGSIVEGTPRCLPWFAQVNRRFVHITWVQLKAAVTV